MVRAPDDRQRREDGPRRLLLAASVRDLVRARRRGRRPARLPAREHRRRPGERRLGARDPGPLPHRRPAAGGPARARLRRRAPGRAGAHRPGGHPPRPDRAGGDDARARHEPVRRRLPRGEHARRAARGCADRRVRLRERASLRRGHLRGLGAPDADLRPRGDPRRRRGVAGALPDPAARGLPLPLADAARPGDGADGADHQHARRGDGRRDHARLRRPRPRQRRRSGADERRDGRDGLRGHARLRLDRAPVARGSRPSSRGSRSAGRRASSSWRRSRASAP